MAVTRTVIFTYTYFCYDERDKNKTCIETGTSTPITLDETQPRFEEALRVWVDQKLDGFDSQIQSDAEGDCQEYSPYHNYCGHEISVIEWYEEGEPECPDWFRSHAEHSRDEIALEEGFIKRIQALQARATVDEFIRTYGKGDGEKYYNLFIADCDKLISSHQALVEYQRTSLSELLADYPECR